ncbi:MAG: type II toxin-antitoxin system HicA family toxin [Nitrospirae bacterium]|nr:type II toxin-antitoxin system HicA family toxin [Nitrospirota bacterium]
MGKLHNLHTDKVLKAFQMAGWIFKSQKGSHIKLAKQGETIILPIHKGKPIKEPVLLHEIKRAGLTTEEFIRLYKE